MIAEFSNVLFFGSTAADAAVTSRPCGPSVSAKATPRQAMKHAKRDEIPAYAGMKCSRWGLLFDTPTRVAPARNTLATVMSSMRAQKKRSVGTRIVSK